MDPMNDALICLQKKRNPTNVGPAKADLEIIRPVQKCGWPENNLLKR